MHRRVPVLLALALAWPGAAAGEPATQPQLAEVLPPQLRQSVHHTVEGVELRDGWYTFPVDSEVGTFVAESLPQLRNLVAEIEILSQARNQFTQGAPRPEQEVPGQFSIEADSAVDIITRPVSSATNLAGQLGDNINQALTGSPVYIPEYHRVDFAAAESADPTTSMHKRNIAAQWGLDVYSSNPAVQDFLNTAAQARAGGRISAGAPAFFRSKQSITRSADAAVDAEVAALIKSETVAGLADGNRRLLAGMQIQAALIDAFMKHAAFSPRHQTRITRYLAALDKVVNRAALLESALRSETERGAVAHEHLAIMLLYFHRQVAPLRKLHFDNNVLQAIHADGGIVMLLPEDVVTWTGDVERAVDAVAKRSQGGGFHNLEVMAAGTVSPSAQVQIGARGFTLRDHAIY